MIRIDNLGKDTPLEVNDKGGKQSVTSLALHLVDPVVLSKLLPDDEFIDRVTDFMVLGEPDYLIQAMQVLVNNEIDIVVRLGRTLKEGANKYKPNNWRLIPQEEHLNHALIHYIAYTIGNEEDDHLDHCLTRLMMTYATEPTDINIYGGFDGRQL